MILFYPEVSEIGVKRNGITDRFSNSVFIYFKIVFAAFCFMYVNNLKTAPLYYDLRFYGVAFFLPE